MANKIRKNKKHQSWIYKGKESSKETDKVEMLRKAINSLTERIISLEPKQNNKKNMV